MKKYSLLFSLLAVIWFFPLGGLYAADTFFCIDGPLRIRNESDISSWQTGSLFLFDKVDIIGKTENKSTIDGISDYWYKIKTNDREGYVFGGYGVVLKEKHEIKKPDDFIKIFPDKFVIDGSGRAIYTSKSEGPVPIVRLSYWIQFMGHDFSLFAHFRLKDMVDAKKITAEYNLDISDARNSFGIGDSYKMLKNPRTSDAIKTKYGIQGRYFFQWWSSGISYDIANFVFELDFDNIFDGILVSVINIWTNEKDTEIGNINNQYIIEARKNRIKEYVIYQILYELIMRTEIEN
jgi:hypothetical protein